MNADEVAQSIDRIVDGPGTKSYRARKLFDLGCDRTDVVELLGMSYSQAHSIWKKEGHGQDSSSSTPGRAVRGPVHSTRSADDAGAPDIRSSGRRTLRLSPSQVRFITQDGHVIVRVDKKDGPHCNQCDRRLTFTLKYLGFVHTDSTAEPTDLEDRYD